MDLPTPSQTVTSDEGPSCRVHGLSCTFVDGTTFCKVCGQWAKRNIPQGPTKGQVLKRKREERAILPNNKPRCASSPTAISERSITVKGKVQSKIRPSPSTFEAVTSPTNKKKINPPKRTCELCHKARKGYENARIDGLAICHSPTYLRSYHITCITTGLNPSMVLYPLGGVELQDAMFVCPKCLDESAQSDTAGITKAILEYMRGRESPAAVVRPEVATPSTIGATTGSQESQIQQTLRDEAEAEFVPADNEKFQGYDRDEIDGLIFQLHQAINDYDLEIREVVRRFDNQDICEEMPLSAWESIDSACSIVSGKEWFQNKWISENLSKRHTSITASLRRMLKIPSDVSLEVDGSLRDLGFSVVHRGFMGWFIFDILNNQCDIYELPNMKSMRAMMTGVSNFAESRWPRKGHHALREVQIRTWYKKDYQEEILRQQDVLRSQLKVYLHPLTKGLGDIAPYSHKRADVIEYTIRLWSYLQSCGGYFDVICPAVGDAFDIALHKPYDGDGLEIDGKVEETKVRWVLFRGFKYTEKGVGGLRSIMEKAHVVV